MEKENDAYEWVAKNINSCTNEFQLICAGDFILLFQKKFGNDELTGKLNALKRERWEYLEHLKPPKP